MNRSARTISRFLLRSGASVRHASSMVRLVVGAVPEQVNIPLHKAAASAQLRAAGVEVEVRSVPEGTGRMVEAVARGEMDLALPVTDGMIAAVAKGMPIEVAGVYVQSPLTWAVSAAGNTQKTSLQQLERMGVSRMGSGSHTMSFYMALLQGMDPNRLSFTVANNFANLRAGVSSGEFDAFLWETFTTQPYFASGELTKLADVQTPWPAFSFICNPERLSQEQSLAIRRAFFPTLAQACKEFTTNTAASIAEIVEHYEHTPEDAAKWLSTVSYSESFTVDAKRMGHAVDVLKQAGVIPKEFQKEKLWAQNSVALVTDSGLGTVSSTASTSASTSSAPRQRLRDHRRPAVQRKSWVVAKQQALARGLSTAAPEGSKHGSE